MSKEDREISRYLPECDIYIGVVMVFPETLTIVFIDMLQVAKTLLQTGVLKQASFSPKITSNSLKIWALAVQSVWNRQF